MYNQQLPVHRLQTDMSYQSPVQERQVRKIVNKFDSKKLHTIVVSKRKDGSFYIIDGQHRVDALKELNISFIEATVHENLTIEEEAEMYYGVNDRPSKNANSKGKSRLRFKEPVAVAIDETVKSVGLEIDYEKSAPTKGYIKAYDALQSIYKGNGANHLGLVLEIIKDSFGEDTRNYQSFILRGFSKLLKVYLHEVDLNFLVKKLQNIGYEGFILEINKKHAGFKTKKECLPFVVVDIYNKNRRQKNQLDKMKLHV
ncbi:TPA: ParB N-terminal domain-containing protein [Staphylococcus aureus]|nr:ParB N-terminal domain-containing protein [Staphylococcus aureus]